MDKSDKSVESNFVDWIISMQTHKQQQLFIEKYTLYFIKTGYLYSWNQKCIRSFILNDRLVLEEPDLLIVVIQWAIHVCWNKAKSETDPNSSSSEKSSSPNVIPAAVCASYYFYKYTSAPKTTATDDYDELINLKGSWLYDLKSALRDQLFTAVTQLLNSSQLLYLIRYPIMPASFISQYLLPCGVIPKSLICEAFRYQTFNNLGYDKKYINVSQSANCEKVIYHGDENLIHNRPLRFEYRQGGGKMFLYRSDFDKHGVLYWIGTNLGRTKSWTNPSISGKVTVKTHSSGFGSGKKENLIARVGSSW